MLTLVFPPPVNSGGWVADRKRRRAGRAPVRGRSRVSQPYDEQPPVPQGQQPFGAPPPMPPVPPGPPQSGYGVPRQPVAGNPYAQPAQGAQPQAYGHGGGQPPPYGTPGNGGFPPPQPGTPAPRKRTGLIAIAAVLAVAVIGGGVWFAVGRGSDSGSDDAKSPTSVGTPGATGSAGSTGETPEATDPTTDPSDEPTASPPARSDNPLVPQPTGTGLQAVWKGSDSTMLVLGDEYADQPTRVNAVFTDSDGFECKGRWQKDESGDFLEVALLCEQDGVRAMSKDRVGNLRQNGDTLAVTWKKGADTFERFQDMDPA
ncbi:hypothetical protein SSIG_04117 [Streptomyces filamentosus NRRL 11379]|uniref:Predicted protein n=1 Tax=Streptomyces filamentosus NRRL 15998 TaxID=457431 RepID=D6ACF3_STRFL|nr:predicted protein [Streptomyces filamentosus NRRL 15998]EWS93521.1 hypothetical protein SSIG_04117 [Streptomyces filamentosus NRRL 11379]